MDASINALATLIKRRSASAQQRSAAVHSLDDLRAKVRAQGSIEVTPAHPLRRWKLPECACSSIAAASRSERPDWYRCVWWPPATWPSQGPCRKPGGTQITICYTRIGAQCNQWDSQEKTPTRETNVAVKRNHDFIDFEPPAEAKE